MRGRGRRHDNVRNYFLRERGRPIVSREEKKNHLCRYCNVMSRSRIGIPTNVTSRPQISASPCFHFVASPRNLPNLFVLIENDRLAIISNQYWAFREKIEMKFLFLILDKLNLVLYWHTKSRKIINFKAHFYSLNILEVIKWILYLQQNYSEQTWKSVVWFRQQPGGSWISSAKGSLTSDNTRIMHSFKCILVGHYLTVRVSL